MTTYFHSHTLEEQLPSSSISYSKTPIKLSKDDSFPPLAEDARKNNDPRKLILPGLVNPPIPCPVHVAIPLPSLVVTTPCPSPYITPPSVPSLMTEQ